MKSFSDLSTKTRWIIILSGLLLVANLLLGRVLMHLSRQAIDTMLSDRMLDIANAAAARLDGDVLGSLTAEDAGSPEYRECLDALVVFQDNIALSYIYAIQQLEDGTFAFSIDPTTKDPGQFGEPVVYTEALYEASQGTPSVDREPYQDEWGRFYSAYSPVYDSKGNVAGVVAVDFDAAWYDEQISKHMLTIFLVSLFSLIAGIAIVTVISGKIKAQFDAVENEITDLDRDMGELARELGLKVKGSIETGNKNGDEIVRVSSKIRFIRDELRKGLEEVRTRAYIDSMTGVKNKTAYMEKRSKLIDDITSGSADFSVVITDINGLKSINDNYGHEEGDRVIIDAAGFLKVVFGERYVYRIGGDEFIVIMESVDARTIEERFMTLDHVLEHFNSYEKDYEVELALSKGYAIYDPNCDKEFRDVFKRADAAMYEDKRRYYMSHGDRRKR